MSSIEMKIWDLATPKPFSIFPEVYYNPKIFKAFVHTYVHSHTHHQKLSTAVKSATIIRVGESHSYTSSPHSGTVKLPELRSR